MPELQFADYSLESVLLVASSLLIFSVLASKVSSVFGVPALLIFLGIGMLAGSEGPGGIEFTNYSLSFAIGSISLAFIIFDGGLRTSWKSVRPILPIGIPLSSLGVLFTAISTGIFARYVLGFSWIEGLLLGSIVSSTDAAAVFSILRAKSLALKGAVKQTLEFEAGSNDPMAIFLTTGVLTLAMTKASGVSIFIFLFLKQVGLGLSVGWLAAKGIHWLVNRVRIEYEGLYSVFLLGFVVFVFSGTSALGGSGFLAVYVLGIVLGNSEFLHKISIFRFHDGIAWLAQISVFLALGLLSFPSHLLPVWKEGILLALFLSFIGRPLSVFIAAPTSRFSKKERIFISWVGLRGVAPVILAILPWSVNFPNAEYYFNLVFFVVLLSVLVQGMTIPWAAKKLGIAEPLKEVPSDDLSQGLLPAGSISIEIVVTPGSVAKGRRIVDLSLPSGVLLTRIERSKRFIIPKGDTAFEVGDRIRGLARPSNLEALKNTFGQVQPMT